MSKLTARIGFGKYEADEYYRIALDAFRRNKLTDAIQNINYALMLIPANPEFLSVRAFFYLEDGVLDKCEDDVNAALKSNPYEVLANYCKGILHYQRREWQEAKQFFLNAWAVDPQRAETQYYLGLVHYRVEDYPNALRWMRQARTLLEKQEDKTRLRDADSWIGELERLAR